MDIDNFRSRARTGRKENKKFFKKLKGVSPRKLDELFHNYHEEVFAETDCLQCANCCKTTGPLFKEKDINRLAKHFGMKPGDFIEDYLRVDEDDDFVLKSVPCPFLGDDNYCSVYEARPKACREFPHTDRNRMHQVLEVTRKNCEVCPAVYEIVERIKTEL